MLYSCTLMATVGVKWSKPMVDCHCCPSGLKVNFPTA